VGAAARRPRRKGFSAKLCCGDLSDRRDSCVTEACSLFILDKGKPVVRPGRKAKGRPIVSAGSLAAERVM
jgi:hypothetical protein